MNIIAFDVYRYSLELKQPLTVLGHQLKIREGLIIRLKSDDGAEGFGEIAPLPELSQETLSEASDQIKFVKEDLLDQTIPNNAEKLDGQLNRWLDHLNLKPSVQFGIESAVLHLLANSKNTTLGYLVSKHARPQVRVSGLLTGSIEDVTAQVAQLLSVGFREFKLKVGGAVDEDIAKVQRVNDVICGKALLHVDANQAWDFDQALTFGKAVGCTAINYIEEPFKDIRKIPKFFDETMIPVALDESLLHLLFDDIRSISGIEVLVLKPTFLGGIEKTYQLMKLAQGMAMSVVISSSFESSVGLKILADLAGLAGSLHHDDSAGLDTLKWFKTDVLKRPVTIKNGTIPLDKQMIQTDDINFSLLKELK